MGNTTPCKDHVNKGDAHFASRDLAEKAVLKDIGETDGKVYGKEEDGINWTRIYRKPSGAVVALQHHGPHLDFLVRSKNDLNRLKGKGSKNLDTVRAIISGLKGIRLRCHFHARPVMFARGSQRSTIKLDPPVQGHLSVTVLEHDTYTDCHDHYLYPQEDSTEKALDKILQPITAANVEKIIVDALDWIATAEKAAKAAESSSGSHGGGAMKAGTQVVISLVPVVGPVVNGIWNIAEGNYGAAALDGAFLVADVVTWGSASSGKAILAGFRGYSALGTTSLKLVGKWTVTNAVGRVGVMGVKAAGTYATSS